MKTNNVQILLVDDHSMVIEGMKAILSSIPCMQVVATASNAFEAMKTLGNNMIQLVFVDINLPDVSGIELCGRIKKEFPHIQVIGLSTFKQRSYVSKMIQHGASGYLVKSADRTEIEAAIQAVMEGKMYFGADINNISSTSTPIDEAPTLTRREKEILKLTASGLSSNEMAEKLFLSPYTIDTHRKNILTKFNAGNTATLISKAAAWGLLD
jgi:two-component system, NarL family, nitrate/nitrite response regulator NarL